MKLIALTGNTCLETNDWSSCRYTKGEGFDVEVENTSGFYASYVMVMVDDVDAFKSMGGTVCNEPVITRIQHPELSYRLDVDKVKDSDIPQVSTINLIPSVWDAKAYLKAHEGITAEIADSPSDKFTPVSLTVVLEAYMDSAI